MPTTITPNTGATITPILVLGYSATRESSTIVSQVLGGGVDVLVQPTKPRAGALELLFTTEASAKQADDIHASGYYFTLTDTDVPSVNMRYVVTGAVTRELTAGRVQWVVTVPFQEVPA